jgi:Na+-transporting methylmalonyl-CoA/oxaloacetate decarboxylase gamma subunit
MVDWGLAGRIAGFGLLTVFVVLGILSLALWLVSLLLYRVINRRNKPEQQAER